MTKQALDLNEVGPVVEQVSSKGAAEVVGGQRGKSRTQASLVHGVSNGAVA